MVQILVPDPEREQHWRRNFEITDDVLKEDYLIGEGQQASFENGAIRTLQFGRNEWTLKVFNDVVEGLCESHAGGEIGDPASIVAS